MERLRFELRKVLGGGEDGEDDFVVKMLNPPPLDAELSQDDLLAIISDLQKMSLDIEKSRMGGIFAPNVEMFSKRDDGK